MNLDEPTKNIVDIEKKSQIQMKFENNFINFDFYLYFVLLLQFKSER